MHEQDKSKVNGKGYLFFDPIDGGHRPQHVLAFARYLKTRPDLRVMFAVHPEVKKQVSQVLDFGEIENVELLSLPLELVNKIKSNNKDVRGGLRGIRVIERIASEHRYQHIHFMHLDTFLPALTLRMVLPMGAFSYSGLYFKPTLHYGDVFGTPLNRREMFFDRIKLGCLRSVLRRRNVTSLLSLDPYFCTSRQISAYSDKVVPIPDLASPPAEPTQPHDVPNRWLERRVRLFLFGAISARKGAFVLAEALQQISATDAKDVALLIAGKVLERESVALDKSLRSLQELQPDLCVDMIQRYISDEELMWLLRACTLVTIPYQRHVGFSGVMCWAAASDRPILTQSFGLVGQEVRKHSLGYSVETSDPAAVATTISRIVQGTDMKECHSEQRRRYAEEHTEWNFAVETFKAIEAGWESSHSGKSSTESKEVR